LSEEVAKTTLETSEVVGAERARRFSESLQHQKEEIAAKVEIHSKRVKM
jgi:hypothetical protein